NLLLGFFFDGLFDDNCPSHTRTPWRGSRGPPITPRTSSRDRARALGGSVADDAAPSANAAGSPARCAGGRSWRAARRPPSGAPPSPAGATTGPATSRARGRVAVPNGASRLPSAVAHIALSPIRRSRDR